MLAFINRYNTIFILLSVACAIGLGILTPTIFPDIHFLGEVFINALKLFALPLISSALMVALGEMSQNLNQLKSLARKAVAYMLVSEIIAVLLALLLFNFFAPGVGVSSSMILESKQIGEVSPQGALSLSQFLLSVIPGNIFEALSKFDLLPVVIFSIMFGLGLALVGEEAKTLLSGIKGIREVSSKCLHGVMSLSPIGIFSLVGSGVSQASLSGSLAQDFKALLSFVGVLVLGLFLHGLWQFILMLVLTKQNPVKVLKRSFPVFSTAFATSSSVATLPIAMQAADELQSTPHVTRFMLPFASAINIGGMMMYEVSAALFFSQVMGLDLSLSQQMLLALVCILAGMAEGGIPETSMVSLVVVFKMVHVPLSAISILLPLDRIIDRLRTMVNIFGNVCGVIVVSFFVKKDNKN